MSSNGERIKAHTKFKYRKNPTLKIALIENGFFTKNYFLKFIIYFAKLAKIG